MKIKVEAEISEDGRIKHVCCECGDFFDEWQGKFTCNNQECRHFNRDFKIVLTLVSED